MGHLTAAELALVQMRGTCRNKDVEGDGPRYTRNLRRRIRKRMGRSIEHGERGGRHGVEVVLRVKVVHGWAKVAAGWWKRWISGGSSYGFERAS